jgi:hypothetical protein
MLSFECGDVTVELDVTSHPDATVDLRGLAVGATGVVAVVRAGGRTEVPLDEDGRFLVTNAGSGPVRLELTTPSGGRVTTSWVTV